MVKYSRLYLISFLLIIFICLIFNLCVVSIYNNHKSSLSKDTTHILHPLPHYENFLNNFEQKQLYMRDKDKIAVNNVDNYNPAPYIENKKQYSDIILPFNDEDDEYIKQTLFIGDSNTLGLSAYNHLSKQNVIGKTSMGIQSVVSLPFVYFDAHSHPLTIVQAVKQLKPRRIVMNFGTNNAEQTQIYDFIRHYSAAISAINKSYPYADIIIAAILPVAKQRHYRNINMQTIDDFNLALMKFCKNNGYMFLDYTDIFKDMATGYMKSEFVIDDGIHLNHYGFKTLIKYVENHQYKTDDKRPSVGYVPKMIHQVVAPISTQATQDKTSGSSDLLSNNICSNTDQKNCDNNYDSNFSQHNSTNSEKIVYDPFS